jgi:hypothetical protein
MKSYHPRLSREGLAAARIVVRLSFLFGRMGAKVAATT